MILQSSHSLADRGADAYFTPPEATIALCNIEKDFLPKYLWEPAAGNGAISNILIDRGYIVHATDLHPYPNSAPNIIPHKDYLRTTPYPLVQGIVTNPPYNLALQFIKKSLKEVSYSAFLLRTNFLESQDRFSFFKATSPSRVWISSRRLPMMHREGWTGPKASSNTCYAWFIWDKNSPDRAQLNWFDWKDYK